MKGIILIDSREKANSHITKRLDELNIPWKIQKLSYGDYSFVWNNHSYENEITVERKSGCDEIIGNFTKGRVRFRKEFERSKGCRVILMVEASMEQLEAGNYRSRMNPKDLKSFLKTWCNKFQLELKFVDKDKACEFMLEQFRGYYLTTCKDSEWRAFTLRK
ncbi:MAG: ERCC4 domain-containing protein [Clostridiaceae bacterium]